MPRTFIEIYQTNDQGNIVNSQQWEVKEYSLQDSYPIVKYYPIGSLYPEYYREPNTHTLKIDALLMDSSPATHQLVPDDYQGMDHE